MTAPAWARISLVGLGLTLLWIGAAGLTAVTAAAVVGAGVWPFTLAEHFHLHYLAAALVATAIAAAVRRAALADLVGLIALVNLIVVAPALSGFRTSAPAGAIRLRVLAANVLTQNRDRVTLARLIERTGADVVVLLEVDRGWLDDLAPALTGYPARVEAPRTDNFGVAIYARTPFTRSRIVDVGHEVPVAVVELAPAAGGLTVIGAHPVPPVSSTALALQRTQLDAIAALAAAATGPCLLIGDLNATPWSAAFQRVVARSGLRDSRRGFGVQATFPSRLGWFGIPIDHALVSPDLAVVDRRVGPPIGSDHRPIVIELAIGPSD